MTKIQKRIEIVRSTVAALSSLSQVSADALRDVLRKHYAEVSITVVNDVADFEQLLISQPDLVFVGIKFVPGTATLGLKDPVKMWLTDFLDEHNIAYTGSGQLAHALELSKPLAKQCAQAAGLQTSPFFVASKSTLPTAAEVPLPYPVFIKPIDRGGGCGIDDQSLAYDYETLVAKVQSIATDFQCDSLVERYLPGREFSVAILKDEYSAAYAAMPIELIAPENKQGARILSAEVKCADTERFAPVENATLKTQVATLALAVFHALGAQDYGRIDIRLDSAGVPNFLEANLIPSVINGYGNFPKACLVNKGMDYETMVLHIVRLGFARKLSKHGVPAANASADTLLVPSRLKPALAA